MKAIVQDTYGSPDVLEFREIDLPLVGDYDVLVRVHAAGVNPADRSIMRGLPYLLRLGFGLRRPRNRVRGIDVAGRVAAVGSSVPRLRPGDEVFGWCWGAFAEYACAAEGNFVPKPANLTFEQAAAVPIAAFTALQAIRDKGAVKPGQQVLIVGASGGVGTFAIQIAKAFGAEVTAVCSTRNVDLVRSLGADQVIDYTRQDFTRGGQRFDFILDNIADRSLAACLRALKPTGTLVPNSGEIGGRWLGGAGRAVQALLVSPLVRQRLRPFLAVERQSDLVVLKELIETGRVTPVIDRTYPLPETPEAIRYLGTGHARGKVVITV